MNKTSKQLETVFQDVTDHFKGSSDIIITPGSGNPPEEYSVIYHRAGVCKAKDAAEVSACDTHVISIALPFGFPHFPPNCLPKSNTFHPDFDSSAICIGDAWETDQSIVNLILHIGRMISGEIYSEDSAFNEEAAEWYKANSSRLPFEKREPDSGQEAAIIQAPALEEKDSATIDTIDTLDSFETIDTLGDADLGQSFSLGNDTPPDTESDKQQLQLLASTMHFHALSQELKKNDEQFDGRSDLEEQTRSAINEAATLFHEAEELEHQGKQEEALEKFHSVEGVVSDYPNLQESRQRLIQAIDLLGGGGSETELAHDNSDSEEPIAVQDDTSDSETGKRTFFAEKNTSPPRKGIFLALGGGLIALMAALVFSYIFLGSSLEKAEKKYAKCQNLLNSGNFKGAEQSCREALERIAEVQVVKQGKKEQLAGKIRTLLNSPKLRQGLAGNTLLNGKYVSQAAKEQLLAFIEAKKNGDTFFEQAHWSDADLSYQRALEIAKKTSIEEKLLAEIHKKQPLIHFNTSMAAGEESISLADWDSAYKHFGQALDITRTNPEFPPEYIIQIELLLKQAEFNTMRNHGHELFKKNEWNKALVSYRRALILSHELNLTESKTTSDLQRNIARTEIYLAIEKGKEAFALAQWDTVIDQYEKAAILLEENAKLLGETNTEESREKLARIMLHTAIIRDKQNVAKHLKSEDLSQAITQLQSIQQTIISSKFADQPEFQTILTEISSQLQDTDKKVLVLEQTAYLTESYKKLFLKHYPAAASSALSAPRVEHLEDIDGKLLFRMQCTETTGGRPLRLQMDYIYSPANGSWQFYSEE